VPRDARSLSQSAQEELRRRGVAAVLSGRTQVEVAELLGVSPRAVSNWMRAHRGGGEQALAAGRRGRRPGEQLALAPWQQGQIAKAIRERNPDQLRLPFFLWTREAVRDLIERRFGLRLALSTVGRYLRRWGFTPQRPVRRAFEQDPAAVRRWLERDYPALARRAKREGAQILWGDEMGLRSDQAAGRSFSPRGTTPVVEKTGQRFGCNVISAISNQGRLNFRVFPGRFTGAVFCDFLERLVKQSRGRKVILIVDGHPVHRSKAARAWAEARPESIELVLLPAYSPELNPDEMLNNDTRHAALTRHRPTSEGELGAQTRRHLHRRQRQPGVVARFFQEEHVRYAAA
jgi:transposase